MFICLAEYREGIERLPDRSAVLPVIAPLKLRIVTVSAKSVRLRHTTSQGTGQSTTIKATHTAMMSILVYFQIWSDTAVTQRGCAAPCKRACI